MSRPTEPQPFGFAPKRAAAIRLQWESRRKYRHTEETDTVVRHAYHLRNDYSNRKAIQSAADKLGWPKWVITHRARVLGLAKAKEKPWTSTEEGLVEQWGWMSLPRIALKLRRAGFQRSETAIHLKMKRLMIKGNLDGYSLRGTATAFGVDEHKVALWIKRGMLTANSTGIAVGQNEKVFVHRNDIRRFILSYPDEIDLAKCEKLWLLDIVSGGKLCEEFRREVA